MEDKGPGSVISPGGATAPSPTQAVPETPQAPVIPVAQAPQASQQPPAPSQSTAPQHPEPTLAWTASEYLQHDKSGKWFAIAFLGSAVIAALVYFTTQDIISAIIVFVALLGLVVFAGRKPGVQDYAVDESVIRVGNKTYHLGEFKAFSVIDDGATIEVAMLPLRRFMPMVTIRVDENQVDDLVNHLAAYLPMEQRKPDPVDTMLRRLKF